MPEQAAAFCSMKELAGYTRQLKSPEPQERRIAADRLGDCDDPTVAESLIPTLRDRDEYVRQAAARSLGRLRAEKAVQQLIPLLDDNDLYVRVWTAFALSRIHHPRGTKTYTEFMDHVASDQRDKINTIISGYP